MIRVVGTRNSSKDKVVKTSKMDKGIMNGVLVFAPTGVS